MLVWRTRLRSVGLLLVIVTVMLPLLLASCASGPQGTDPTSVKVELVTDPPAVQKGQSAKVRAQLTGLTPTKELKVQFDIRKPDKRSLPQLKDARLIDGQYEIEHTFDQAGTYTLYIHVYEGELHITKKRELTVS
ncbi:FixH family protein [Paenibacillus sp. YYML68]|uniref:FixH family protein n=1 Tax=Paenibacillus sp. YYML68 TaxID=2909250 RepID=UPI0024910B33|nr:FixH family protein [Paenibacillus sp. YYML68]